MNHFTQHRNVRINLHIRSQLQLITDIILKNIPDVRSILLAGGFGKGEGSVKITEDGTIVCLRDFDVVAIVDRIPREETVKKIYDQIHRLLGLLNPEHMLFRFSDFVVEIRFLRKKDLIYSDVWFYDLKAASKLLYGEDVRDLIRWSKEDIPLSSGLRILFEKVCGLLGLFSYDCLRAEKLSEEKRELLIFECFKTFIEIGTALCILAGSYEPKYAQRAQFFGELYFDEFPELAKVLPDLPEKVVESTSFKLKPDFTKVHQDPIDLWFSARDYLGVVLRFYVATYLSIATLDWDDLTNYTKNLAQDYYKPFLNSLLNAKLRFSNNILLHITSFLFQTLTNLEYAYVVTRNARRPYLGPLSRCYISPSLKFFQAGIMILFSLNEDGTVDKELLRKAIEELRHCIPVENSTLDASGWDALRKNFLKAYRLYRGYHFVK